MTTYYNPADHTADEWRAMAKQCLQESADSWERSDTDGFLSQWASQSMALMYRHMADLADNGGKAVLPWVFELVGDEWRPVNDWRWIETRYGSSILIPGDEYGKGRFFNPSMARTGAARQRNDERKGFRMGRVECEVVSRFTGGHAARPYDERKHGAELTVISTAAYDYDES